MEYNTSNNTCAPEIPEILEYESDTEPDHAVEESIESILQSYTAFTENNLDSRLTPEISHSFDNFIVMYLKGLSTRSARESVLMLRKYLSEVALAASMLPFKQMHAQFVWGRCSPP